MAMTPVYNGLKPISTPENITRAEGMRRILACRRALLAALKDARNYGYTEALVLQNIRGWEAL